MRNRRSRVRRVDDGPPDDTLLTLPDDTSAVEDHWPDDAHTSHKRGSDNCADLRRPLADDTLERRNRRSAPLTAMPAITGQNRNNSVQRRFLGFLSFSSGAVLLDSFFGAPSP